MAADLPDIDQSHPIPSLTSLDVHGVRKGGGSDLAIVVATPLRGDEYSKRRLERKIENYANAIASPGYALHF
jgi:hypothetical protein